MIPLKLQLKNFLSYGPDLQTIDLSTYPLICLSGKNGHGKSALLDAITWALWGQARKVMGNAKADQGLLRLGQTQMMVSLDFEFNNQIYRVRREFTVTYGKPYATLDFGMIQHDDTFIPLTDKTISLTQDVIERTLNLSFDSFSNSAFLRQGQSNEFSKKSPKDRKEILATILGLNQYENIRKLAMEKIRQATTDKANHLALQEKIEQELQKKSDIIAQLLEVDANLVTLSTQHLSLDNKKKELANIQKQLFEDQKNYQVLTFHHKQLVDKEYENIALLQAQIRQWKTIHKKQLHLPNPKLLEQQKQVLINDIKNYQYALQKNLEIKETYLKYKEQAQQIIHQIKEKQSQTLNQQKINIERLFIEQQANDAQLQNLSKQLFDVEQEQYQNNIALKSIQNNLTSHDMILKKHTELEKHFERRKEYYQKFLEQGKWLTSELENLEQKKELAHDDDDPSCPLCEQNLSAARKRFLKQKFVEQEHFLRHRLQRITKVVKQLKIILIKQHKELESCKSGVEQLTLLQVKKEEHAKALEKCMAHSNEIKTQKTAAEKKLKEISAHIVTEQAILHKLIQQESSLIEQNNEYIAINTSLKQLDADAKKTTYNQELHKKATEQLQEIEGQLNEYTQITQDLTLQSQRQKTISEQCEQIKQLRNEKIALEKEHKKYEHLTLRQHAYEQEEISLIHKTKELTQQKELLLSQKARLETQKTYLENKEKEHKALQQLIIELQEILYDYQAIASATGKDGIQALLIEDAIPEIEHEANNLLSRLTHNQAQVFFESLRDLKKGGSKETLDIKISDATGIRPYEMFSGGEAFRIDFAIRIAISKLLARRAGTSLQTLIIDEGFGSQDEEGLTLIMDSLYKIQEDFSKIIIVSHLPSMKDQFPVHFVVEKGPNGSTVNVIEQG